jgi:cardiolipin synthase
MSFSWGLVLGVAQVVWVAGIAAFIMLERRSPTATLAWITMVAALPLIGVAIYLVIGPRRLRRKKLRLGLARQRIGHLMRTWKQARAHVLSLQGQLMRAGAQLGRLPPEEASQVQLFFDGDACYDDLVAAILRARHHVHLEYYIFRDDLTGKRIMDALVERAKAGIEVRLLADAVGEGLGSKVVRTMRDAGVDVRFFNGIRSFRVWRRLMNFRTHRKIVVIDGWFGYTGGMNVTDDHSARVKGDAAWRDTHVRMAGPAVHGLQATFLENWVFTTGDDLGCARQERFVAFFPPTPAGWELPDATDLGRDHATGSATGGAPAVLSAAVTPVASVTPSKGSVLGTDRQISQILASGPDDDVYAIEAFYFAAITSAHERLWLTTPYFVPGEAILAAIASAAHRGVDVRLLFPRKTDSIWVDAASRTYHDELLAAGAHIYLYEPPMLHAKTAVIDDALAIVGTANLDNRSFRLNFEVVASFYGGPCVADLARAFELDLKHAKRQQLREAKSPFAQRLMDSAARLLAPQL